MLQGKRIWDKGDKNETFDKDNTIKYHTYKINVFQMLI